MSDQLDLFSLPVAPARATDPETSHMAAIIPIGQRTTDRALVLELLYENRDGLTDFDLAARATQRFGRLFKQTSLGKRRGELVSLGLVERARDDDGAPVHGRSDTGSPAIVWRITSEGVDYFRNYPFVVDSDPTPAQGMVRP